MSYKYLVEYAGFKRKLSTDANSDIENKIREAFGIVDESVLHINFKDPEWDNERVLVGNTEELPDRETRHAFS